ncbi:hypothetical protein INT43_002275 [Umbelopsis isabellina]|uniref:GST N-terminal domain-containing protein n=1 Tax=Mortierella isabellina TaxID=91625 RepID=A0A8H7Q4Q2_MORIS|nr:hypothetical protein INT43_002275 [Umbelopsis isabellina]
MSSTSTLYLLNQTYSSWSLRAWLAARFVNYPCNVHVFRLSKDIDYGTPKAVEMLSQAGPTKKVPTLHVEVDGEKIIIFETLAIIEFLYEANPQIWPSGKANRALARAISAEMSASFMSLRSNYPMNVKARLPFSQAYFDQIPGNATDLARVVKIFSTCRARVNEREELKKIDQGFLFGAFTGADAMYAPVCWRIKSYGLPVEDEAAKQYVETLLNSDLVQQWVQEAALETEVIPVSEIEPLIKQAEQQ